MTNSAVVTRIDQAGRAVLTMNRPKLHNAFDEQLIATLTAELKRVEADDQVRVVLLTGSGKSFSAGADLNWMRRMADYTPEDNLKDAMGLAGLMETLNGLKKPTIALVQGAAYGGGVGLVACCDMALASPQASFCLSEVRLGLIPAVISPYLVAAIGNRSARRYFLTAEAFDASEAYRMGLVHQVVPMEELLPAALRLSDFLLQNGPRAMEAAKELVAAVSSGPIDVAMIAGTARRIAAIRASKEAKEGLSAFLEKRKPAWTK